MKFEELIKFDSTIVVKSGNPESLDILGISHSDDPLTNTFVFIKGYRFHKNLGRKANETKFPNCGLFIQEDYYHQLKQEDVDQLQVKFNWIATVNDVDQSMCKLSKPYYDELFSELNLQVDGRQMGTAIIDSSAEISQGVFVGEDVIIDANVKILPGCVILPKVRIGKNTILYPNITLYPYTEIGDNCRIHAGTVMGTDGFGYNFFDGEHQKIWHIAGVKIGNNVEIGCNTMIDAGAFTATVIGDGSKIDNDVQISHNVKIDKHVIICGKTGLAGSVEVKDYCGFGAGAGVAPSAIIEQGAQVAARAVVSENTIVKAKEIVAGHPARPLKEWMRSQATLRKLSKK
jgi:UDP-3-O-[3-hydroxymyristoyl] glucosamine N-acyltransferase